METALVRFLPAALLALAPMLVLPGVAPAQQSFVGADGLSRYMGVVILCPAGTRAAPCNFGGGGGGGGNVSVQLGGAPVGLQNRFPVADPALDGLIAGGALTVACTGGCGAANASVGATGAAAPASATELALPNGGGVLTAPVLAADGGLPAHVTDFPATQAVSGTFWQPVQPVSAAALPLPAGAATAAAQTAVQSAPGTAAATALTVQGAAAGVALPVSCTNCGGSGANASVGAVGSAVPTSATAIGLAAGGGNLAIPVLAADGGLPAHVSNFPATQAVTDATLESTVSAGAVAVSAASLPLPAGAAKSAFQTNVQAPAAPASPTATASTLIGCVYNSTLPNFTNGQQGAVQCDTYGRQIVATVPSATNQPAYLQAVSSGGAATYRAINAASSAMAAAVKAAGGLLYGYDICNSGSGAVYFRLFNLAVAPTVGGSTPVLNRIVAAGACASFSSDLGLTFGTGIALDVTSGSLADSHTGTIAAANQVTAAIYYK